MYNTFAVDMERIINFNIYTINTFGLWFLNIVYICVLYYTTLATPTTRLIDNFF